MFYGRILTHSRVLKKACYASTYPMCDYQPPSPIRKGRMATTRSSQTLPVYNRKVLKVNRGFEKSYQLLIVILPHTHPSVGQPLQPRSSCQVEPASFRPRMHDETSNGMEIRLMRFVGRVREQTPNFFRFPRCQQRTFLGDQDQSEHWKVHLK